MAQVQVSFRPIIGDKDLPVLIGGHGPWVHVEIWVQLLDFYLQPPLLQEPAQGRRRDPLAQAGHHASSHKDIVCHSPFSPFTGRSLFSQLDPGSLPLQIRKQRTDALDKVLHLLGTPAGIQLLVQQPLHIPS